VAKEHVSKVEQTIRTIKEWTRGLLATLPFQHIPRCMKIKFVYFMLLWLNSFPVKDGISAAFPPWELLVRWQMDYSKHCRVLLGTYCEVHDKPSPSNTMTPQMHKGIAMSPTGNLQGTVKFFCLTTGCILKQRSFTPYPMPDRVIKRVNVIGLREKQGRTFWFLNRRQEPYNWTDTVPEDDPKFQGLLKDEEEAAYPNISTEFPGVELKSKEVDYAAVTDEPVPNFEQLAATVLDNAGIDLQDPLHTTRAAAGRTGLTLVEADDDEIVYEITFALLDAGLDGGNVVPNDAPAPHPNGGDPIFDMPNETVKVTTNQRYLDQSCRSVVGHQPYNTYSPRMSFLQMGEVHAHRSVLDATRYAGMMKQEQIHATTWSETTFAIDDT
jgi:hypothetical protein